MLKLLFLEGVDIPPANLRWNLRWRDVEGVENPFGQRKLIRSKNRHSTLSLRIWRWNNGSLVGADVIILNRDHDVVIARFIALFLFKSGEGEELSRLIHGGGRTDLLTKIGIRRRPFSKTLIWLSGIVLCRPVPGKNTARFACELEFYLLDCMGDDVAYALNWS